MQTPIQISFHQMEHSPAMEVRIREKVETIVGGGPGTRNDAADDFEGALKAAFDAAKRQLHDQVETMRGD